MRLTKSGKIITRIIAAVLVLSLAAVPVIADDEQESLEEANEYLQSQIEEEEARIAALQDNIDDLEVYIMSVNEEMDHITEIIDNYEEQKIEKQENIDNLKINITDLEADIEEKEEEIAHQYELMKKRIRFLYENVDTNYFEAIFSSGSFSEAVEKIQYLLEITSYDRRMMDQLQLLVQGVEQVKDEKETRVAEINSEIEGISDLQDAQAAQQDLYEQVKAMKQVEIEERKAEISDAEEMIEAFRSEIAENQEEINALIAAYEEQMAREAEERARAEEEARQAYEEESRRIEAENESRRLEWEAESRRIEEENESRRLAWEEESRRLEEEAAAREDETDEYGEIIEPEVPEEPEIETIEEPYYEEPTTIDPSEYQGGEGVSFCWPLPAGYTNITSGFGDRSWDKDLPPSAWYHYGIDIACPYGTPVYAVEDGVVVVSKWSDSLGYMMAVYHGNGIFSEMHHLSSLNCGVGEIVSQGQTIAYSGDTGYLCYGAHLHFGVCTGSDAWALADYVDPAPYLGL